jgi:hypothetical protein
MKRITENRLIVLLGCCLLGLLVFGCSEKTVNNSSGEDDVVIDLDLQTAPAETMSLVSVWLLTVTGPDMDTVVAELRLVDSRYVTGQIEVPVGERRHFVLEGLMGSVVSAARVIYRGSTVAPVRPGMVTTLNIVLHPVAAMVTMTPVFSEVAPGGTLNLAVKVYNVPGVVSFQSELSWDWEYLSNAWAERPPSQPEGVRVELAHEGGWGSLWVESMIGEIQTPLVDARGDGVLALLSFNVVTPTGEFPTRTDIYFAQSNGTLTLITASGDTLGFDSILVESPAAGARLLPIADREVVFPDPVLDSYIRQLDSIPTGEPIMLSKVIWHTYLSFSERGVQNLAGIENLINLTGIYMNWNPTGSTISYLSNLPALAYLYAEDNAIVNIGPLATLTNLENLDLDLNFISNLTPLAGLSRLRYLQLGNNQISDLSPLSHLSDLQSLYLSSNQISDLTPLQGLTKLSYLDLHSNQITDILPLVNNPGLGQYDYIELWDNPSLDNDPVQQGYIATLRARGVTVIMTGVGTEGG